ncbi:coiled-coil domain-containing protein 97 [Drosophila persimilis]|uniref:coiled-coil domain-containing protein 97 n=1 Tax=Drosophila persimilis TaxID=7234 RepID=UPI000F083609|nr:coiled-coil domain-containing protein 97 [Drosophila persimilis]
MTTGDGVDDSGAQGNGTGAQKASLPSQLMDIFKSLAENDKIIFKSQQIDDPELPFVEKQQIAQESFEKNRENFLIRFGSFLNASQLSSFQSLAIREPIKAEENLEEMCLLLEDFKRKLNTRTVCVKNRRYQALQQLLQKGEYFSEHEMMQRAPDLYQELVGQYLTEKEKKARDSYDVRNTSFSGILMHTLEKKQRDELLEGTQLQTAMEEEEQKPQERQEDEEPVVASSSSRRTSEARVEPQISEVHASPEEEEEEELPPVVCEDFEVPAACRRQWGEFEEDAPIACSTSQNVVPPATLKVTKISTPEYYNPGERELLRNEFLSMMKERFLSGEDKDFDYTAVDDDSTLDDLKLIEQDEEDAYFEPSDEEVEQPVDKPDEASSSEDELDVYMRHLNNHHSLQQH